MEIKRKCSQNENANICIPHIKSFNFVSTSLWNCFPLPNKHNLWNMLNQILLVFSQPCVCVCVCVYVCICYILYSEGLYNHSNVWRTNITSILHCGVANPTSCPGPIRRWWQQLWRQIVQLEVVVMTTRMPVYMWLRLFGKTEARKQSSRLKEDCQLGYS